MPLIKWRPSLMISYPVERNFAAAVFWHRIAWVLKLLAVPALAFWIVWDNLMQEKAFISPTFSDADTYVDKKMHKIDCVPTRLRSGDRFFTDAGVFEWDYFGNLLYNQNGTHEYQGGDIGRCDVAEFRTVVDPSREEAVVSHIYVVCNTPDFKGMLHTSTTDGAPRDVELLNKGPPRKAWDYPIADKKSLAAANVQDYYQNAANNLVRNMTALYKNATSHPVRMKLQPYGLGCWNRSETTYEECFNWRFGIMGNSAFSQSRTEYSNGTVNYNPDWIIWPSVNRYLIALRDAVRYDLGSPNNGSNPLVDKDSQRKAVFDVYYECKRMEFKDPAGAIIVFVSTFYGLWKSWEAFVEFFFVLFSKKQPEDEDKPGGTPEEGVPMLGHNPPPQFVAK